MRDVGPKDVRDIAADVMVHNTLHIIRDINKVKTSSCVRKCFMTYIQALISQRVTGLMKDATIVASAPDPNPAPSAGTAHVDWDFLSLEQWRLSVASPVPLIVDTGFVSNEPALI